HRACRTQRQECRDYAEFRKICRIARRRYSAAADSDNRVLDSRLRPCPCRQMASIRNHVVFSSLRGTRGYWVGTFVDQNEHIPWEKLSISSLLSSAAGFGSRLRDHSPVCTTTQSG